MSLKIELVNLRQHVDAWMHKEGTAAGSFAHSAVVSFIEHVEGAEYLQNAINYVEQHGYSVTIVKKAATETVAPAV